MAKLFSYSKKENDDGTTRTKFNIHPVLSFCLIAVFIIVSMSSCEAIFGN